MAWPALSDLRGRLRSILNESTAAFWTDAELNRYINDGERDVAAKSECIQSVSALSTALYATMYRQVLFSGYKVLFVENTSATIPVGLQKITPKQMGRKSYTSGAPQYWFPWGQYIIIDPLPTASYNLNVYTANYPTYEMSADTDTPQIPSECIECIFPYAAYRALWKSKKWGQSALYYSEYIAMVQQKKSLFDMFTIDNKPTITQPEVVEYVSGGGQQNV